ncbi:ABC transporter ATP-binding protein [Microbacterium sp. NPDC058342]|uniref:ABC transporter ATP-binding protein n=1 Tax=Microbacterium sp. NPDC058342 TaxID=3346454 RepID=UPI003664E590
MTLIAAGLSLGYGRRPVVADVDLAFEPGRLTVIIGPNGSGKSTLLRGLSGLLRPSDGSVRMQGREISRLSPPVLARMRALLPQAPLPPEGLSVRELVARGRHPHRGVLAPWSARDGEVVDDALTRVDLLHLADAPIESLSGGQRQRAWIALVLAQEAGIVLLDEPTTYLDLAHAVDVLVAVRRVAAQGRTVVAVLHDLTLAARFADRIVVMAEGRVVAAGAPQQIFADDLLQEVFGLSARVVEVEGAPVVVPLDVPAEVDRI